MLNAVPESTDTIESMRNVKQQWNVWINCGWKAQQYNSCKKCVQHGIHYNICQYSTGQTNVKSAHKWLTGHSVIHFDPCTPLHAKAAHANAPRIAHNTCKLTADTQSWCTNRTTLTSPAVKARVCGLPHENKCTAKWPVKDEFVSDRPSQLFQNIRKVLRCLEQQSRQRYAADKWPKNISKQTLGNVAAPISKWRRKNLSLLPKLSAEKA